jgi:hypothetical protein
VVGLTAEILRFAQDDNISYNAIIPRTLIRLG